MMKLSADQISGYLARIGIEVPIYPDLSDLNKLVYAHLTHVPFEALDVWATGACPSLSVEDLYRKIVVNRRGGYCFELNTLFRVLLDSLGFDAYQAIASLLDENEVAAPPAHNVIISVFNDQKYLVDVGFGGPVPLEAMELKEHSAGAFRLEQKNGFWYLYHEDKPVIRFRDIPAQMIELEPLNFYISQKPDIHFRNRVFVSQRMPDGRICSLRGDEFTIRSNGETKTVTVNSLEQVKEILNSYFGIQEEMVMFSDKK